MRTHRHVLRSLFLLVFSVALSSSFVLAQVAQKTPATSAETILRAADLDSILPPAVFFSGQSATVQKRNSGGVRFPDGALIFVAKVDTGGYSSGVQEKYQSYLITETPITIGSNSLPPGAYGVGFIGNKFIVMDIGGHDLFTADSQRDDAMARPTPLQVLADTTPQKYRLYSGRAYVTFSRDSSTKK